MPRGDPGLTGVRVRELIEPLGFQVARSSITTWGEVRPLFLRLRTHQRRCYRPDEIWQRDLRETSELVPVGHHQVRCAWVVVGCLGYAHVGVG
jgi:hypothetical protein